MASQTNLASTKSIVVIFQLPGTARCEDIKENLQATAERLGGTIETRHLITDSDPARAMMRLYSIVSEPVSRACSGHAMRRHIELSALRTANTLSVSPAKQSARGKQ